jgi:thiamine-monophosphate kinase
MKLSQIGEFGLIDRLKEKVFQDDHRVVVGIGDDAAAIRASSGELLLVTTDVLVERVHFDRRVHSFRHIGWRAMAANVSDIAAMGGRPGHALVSICLPGNIAVEQAEEIYEGMQAVADEYDVHIIGGDTVRAPRELVISVCLTGEAEEKTLVTRAGARVGDKICVTGHLGGSRAGLLMLQPAEDLAGSTTGSLPENEWSRIRDRHLWPRPRLREAQLLAAGGSIHAMIDVSDGLAGEVGHIARESGLGAEIWSEKIPLDPQTRRVAEHLGAPALEFALHGGEDFELVFTSSPEDTSRIAEKVQERTGTPVTVIGEILPQKEGVVIVSAGGSRKPLRAEGYRHF